MNDGKAAHAILAAGRTGEPTAQPRRFQDVAPALATEPECIGCPEFPCPSVPDELAARSGVVSCEVKEAERDLAAAEAAYRRTVADAKIRVARRLEWLQECSRRLRAAKQRAC